MNFFRLQGKGITFNEMQNYDSIHMSEDDYDRPGGLTASINADGYDGGSQFGGAPMDDDMEVVVFQGCIIERIYDGYLTEPSEEIARFSAPKWLEMIESGEAYDYEDWS